VFWVYTVYSVECYATRPSVGSRRVTNLFELKLRRTVTVFSASASYPLILIDVNQIVLSKNLTEKPGLLGAT